MDVVWDLVASFWWVLWRILLIAAVVGVVVGVWTYFRVRSGGDDEAPADETGGDGERGES